MAINQQALGALAANLMDQVDVHGDDATIRAMGFIVAVDDGDGSITYHYSFKDGEGGDLAAHEGLGLLAVVRNGLSA